MMYINLIDNYKPEMVATPTKAHLKDVKEKHIRHYLF